VEVTKGKPKHTFLVCDKCGFEIDCYDSIDTQAKLKKNGWVTRTKEYAFEMNTRFIPKHYCSKCAAALKIKLIL
jgi:Fe2+ or Zn2+ uptake regulation protein